MDTTTWFYNIEKGRGGRNGNTGDPEKLTRSTKQVFFGVSQLLLFMIVAAEPSGFFTGLIFRDINLRAVVACQSNNVTRTYSNAG